MRGNRSAMIAPPEVPPPEAHGSSSHIRETLMEVKSQHLPETLEVRLRQWFGEDVSDVIGRGHVNDVCKSFHQ
jgi:hypothetical protein